MHLGVDRRLAGLQPLDDVELPQRAAAVEQARMQAADQLLQLLEGAGLGQHDAADVVVEIDVVVVDPDRVRQLERHLRQLALEHLGQVHAARQYAPSRPRRSRPHSPRAGRRCSGCPRAWASRASPGAGRRRQCRSGVFMWKLLPAGHPVATAERAIAAVSIILADAQAQLNVPPANSLKISGPAWHDHGARLCLVLTSAGECPVGSDTARMRRLALPSANEPASTEYGQRQPAPPHPAPAAQAAGRATCCPCSASAPVQDLMQIARELGPIFWLDMMGKPMVVVSGYRWSTRSATRRASRRARAAPLRRLRSAGARPVHRRHAGAALVKIAQHPAADLRAARHAGLPRRDARSRRSAAC